MRRETFSPYAQPRPAAEARRLAPAPQPNAWSQDAPPPLPANQPGPAWTALPYEADEEESEWPVSETPAPRPSWQESPQQPAPRQFAPTENAGLNIVDPNLEARRALFAAKVQSSGGRPAPLTLAPASIPAPAAPLVGPGGAPQLEIVFFKFGGADLSPENLQTLARNAQILLNHPGWSVVVEGHADAAGPATGNEKLARQRAEKVARHLISLGVDPSRITVESYGETRPLVPGTSKEANRKNRRVQFLLFQPEAAPQ